MTIVYEIVHYAPERLINDFKKYWMIAFLNCVIGTTTTHAQLTFPQPKPEYKLIILVYIDY